MKKFNRLALALLIATSFTFSCQTKQTTESAPNELNYLKKDLLPQLRLTIPEFPKEGSNEQRFDELEIRRQQKLRTAKDCERAESEVKVTLKSFYGLPYGALDDQQIEKLTPFFENIRTEAGPYIGQVKNSFSRTRPYVYLKNVNPCIQKEKSLAYPSGHATLAALYGDVLINLFPEKTAQIRARQNQIGRDRILAGVHHPTDVKSGMTLGSALYTELLKSENFKTDLEKTKQLVH